MLRFAVPFTRAVARFNETRATQSFDQATHPEWHKVRLEVGFPYGFTLYYGSVEGGAFVWVYDFDWRVLFGR